MAIINSNRRFYRNSTSNVKFNCRCYRCSQKISGEEIKKVIIKMGDDMTYTFCESCVRAIEAFINNDDVATEGDVTVTVKKEKVDSLVQKTVDSAIEKFEKREQKKEQKEQPAPANEDDVYNIQFSNLNKFNRAIKLLESNNIDFKHLQHVDGVDDMPWGVLQIRREDYKFWRKAYLDAENKEASEAKPVTITLPEKPKPKANYDKFPPVTRKGLDSRKTKPFNNGGVRAWNLLYIIYSNGCSTQEFAEAYGLEKGQLNNLVSDFKKVANRVNLYEDLTFRSNKIEKAVRKIAEDSNVRFEDLTYVREITGPFDELYFKPAPDRSVVDKNPVSYD